MHCAACEKTVFELLRFEKGVKDLKVDHVSNTIKVDYDKRKNNVESLVKVIESKGYKAEQITPEEYAILINSKKQEPNGNQEQKH
jgi:copper chaperone CopZ